FGGARGNVAWRQVAEARILSFEKIVALRFGNLVGRTPVPFLFRHPYATVIAQRLRHQSQFGLMIAADGNASGLNLCETRVGKRRALFVGAIRRRDVAT